ncbi:dnaJ homolog subfamily C member 4 isoform X1 [Scleropages formosus]|uniref:DnaJ (Hsp40) homolog, subfamily C, member 4 n=2 Tax=Scleropages formosus TaxID=113540 RepID=A0A8C9WN22_SCLFO|nr:dnaJ homolog subfamily C member 4 isoform X1 [Scleropages formosus]
MKTEKESPVSLIMQLEAQLHLCHRCLLYYKTGVRFFSRCTSNRSAVNYYEVLGVKPDASLEEIKKAFFEKSRKLHPDSDPANPQLHTQFVALNEAYRVLSRDVSRKEYDLRFRHRYYSRGPFAQMSNHIYRSPPSKEHAESMRYWEQFHYAPPQESTKDRQQRQKKANVRLVGYCLAAMFASICIHYLGFRKLEEIHNNFMDEKDREITQIYNECKERARVNGFQKQMEILRQKHAEFVEKHKFRRGGDNK